MTADIRCPASGDNNYPDAFCARPLRLRVTDRVTISVSKKMKHQLPVDLSCTWWRPNKIVAPNMDVGGYGCTTFKGAKVANYSDLVGCMQEAACQITGWFEHYRRSAHLR